jgi:tRNA 2-selenouridine synthase
VKNKTLYKKVLMETISPEKLLSCYRSLPVIDVRSPGEFAQGHIAGAHNLPLFSDDIRALVGTIYVQQGKGSAIQEALKHVNLHTIMSQANSLVPPGPIIVHCWRGGMRSKSVAWLLELNGYLVCLLEGGYKAFRRQTQNIFEQKYPFLVIGGLTGSGKTKLLQQLTLENKQVIDLEGLACHRGSSFGALGLEQQPTQQQFENELAFQLANLDLSKPIFIEDESIKIGKLSIPKSLFEQIKIGTMLFLDVPYEQRVENLMEEYARYPQQEFIDCINRVSQQIGPENTKIAIALVQQNQWRELCTLLLKYYDKKYLGSLESRKLPSITKISSIKDLL